MRDWVNKNSTAVTVAAVLILVVCLVFIFTRSANPDRAVDGPPGAYFFDLGAQVSNPLDALFVAPVNEIPPITAPSGGVGVKAYVYSCGEPTDKSKLFIGYLETYTPEAKETVIKIHRHVPTDPSDPGPMVNLEDVASLQEGHLIAPSDDLDHWVPFDSEEAMEIIQEVERRCKGNRQAIRCEPGQVGAVLR